MSYICYRYIYHKNNVSRFLFGFIIPTIQEFNVQGNNIKLSESISLEYQYINEDQYIQFIDNSFCDFSIIGFNSTKPIEIQDKKTSFFSQERFNHIIFSSHKYINWWLEDYSNLSPEEIMDILKELNHFCSPFFPKYSILNPPRSLPIGSFLIMKDTITLDSLVSIQPSFKPNSNNEFPLSIKFQDSIIGNQHTARIRLISIADDLMINEIFLISENEKHYILDNVCLELIIEIFNKDGNSIYDEHLTYIIEIDIELNSIGRGNIQLNDKLSKKIPSLSQISSRDSKPYLSTSTVDRDLEEKYNKFHKILNKIYHQNPSEKKGREEISQVFWYEKMNSSEAINKIIELVTSAQTAYIFDPYFSSMIKDDNTIDDNALLILNRLYGNVIIFTSTKNSDELQNILKSLKPLHQRRLELSIKSIPSLHDRYLLLENNQGQKLYSLTNSLSSAMKELPIGINEIVGDAKNKALVYLKNIRSSATPIYDHIFDLQKTDDIPWYNMNYVSELLISLPVNDDFKLSAAIIPTIQKNFDTSNLTISIKLLAFGEILTHIREDYTIWNNKLRSFIEQYKGEISLEDITKFLIDNKLYSPPPYSMINIVLPSEFNFSSYEILKNWQRFPRHLGYTDRVLYGYKKLLEELYYVDPSLFFTYFLELKHYPLQQIFKNIISESPINEPLLHIHSNITTVKLLSLLTLLEKPIYVMDSKSKEAIIKSNIPHSLLFTILISDAYINKNNQVFTSEYLKFLNNFSEFDISNLSDEDEKYLTKYSETLIEVLPQLDNFNLELAQKTIISYLNRKNHIWYTLTTNAKALQSLLELVYKITDQDKGNFLKKLHQDYNLNQKYDFVTLPLASKLFSYDRFGDNNRIVQVMLYIFARSSDNTKVLSDVMNKIIHSLFVSLKQKYSSHMNFNFLLLHGFFDIIIHHSDLETDKCRQLLDCLRDSELFDIFYTLYYQTGDQEIESIFLKITALIEYISKSLENSMLSGDKKFIIVHACEIITRLSQRYPKEKSDSLKRHLKNSVNRIFAESFILSFTEGKND